jgi:hypothetical protein
MRKCRGVASETWLEIHSASTRRDCIRPAEEFIYCCMARTIRRRKLSSSFYPKNPFPAGNFYLVGEVKQNLPLA